MTSVYKKPTFTGHYLNFQSRCSKQRKIGLIKTLYHRAQKISSPELLSNEIKTVKEILRKNEYPNNLIERVLNSKAERSNINVPSMEKCPVLLMLTYKRVKSNFIEKKDITEKTYLFAKPRIIYK